MDQKTRKNIQEKLKKRTMQLPPIFQEFLKENQKTLSLSSRYEYAKDFHLFSDHLRDTYAEDVTDQLIIHLEKRDYLNFLQKVYRHTRSFQTTAEQETNQQFKNGYYGLSRKQYSLNHFLRYLYQTDRLKKEISLLGETLPETTPAAPRYVDASLLENFDTLFIPKKGFKTTREASFEEKNRPRNLAILAVLFYCGLKIHEIVELKRKNIELNKQMIYIDRKVNRLDKAVIPNEALPYLTHYLELIEKDTTAESFVFRSSHDQQISPRTIRQILSKVTIANNLSPELCRKTFGYYVDLYLDDLDTVNYLYGNRYLNPHSFEKISKKMREFSYREFAKETRRNNHSLMI
ncbi:integrase [Enterococcus durans]|uniref:tyrosine-type recombinase/integrase n=1 Tax=Enterococcus durans TaxID=53345 RepID=UPI000F513231|nr:tyrosine-type recombinase/integrase [Enterococcus durans]NJE64333.1 integrase [Enterococcus durans]ROX82877.1 integrase [Enterococcus durans]HJG23813.1 tyrosine-type recombinase/integrase [Enterococcus durans]